jgi:hypothetical protein
MLSLHHHPKRRGINNNIEANVQSFRRKVNRGTTQVSTCNLILKGVQMQESGLRAQHAHPRSLLGTCAGEQPLQDSCKQSAGCLRKLCIAGAYACCDHAQLLQASTICPAQHNTGAKVGAYTVHLMLGQ